MYVCVCVSLSVTLYIQNKWPDSFVACGSDGDAEAMKTASEAVKIVVGAQRLTPNTEVNQVPGGGRTDSSVSVDTNKQLAY